MKKIYQSLFTAAAMSAGLLLAPQRAWSEDAPPAAAVQPGAQIETLVVGTIKVNESLTEAAATEGRTNKLRRVTEAMDTQFRAALGSSRKFRIIAGSDLGEILKQHKLNPLQDSNDANASRVGALRPPKYVVIPTMDDFQDVAETLQSEGHEPLASARRIRISVVASIYDINTGEIKETANVQVNDRKASNDTAGIVSSGDAKDELLLVLTRRAAEQAANRVVDVIFPAKIISHIDKTVTINRGDGTSIAIGQVWDAFALGEEMKDPDTGEVLGRQEVPSGKVRVTAVYPKYSQAEILEDTGIDKGHVLRLHEIKTPAANAPANPLNRQ